MMKLATFLALIATAYAANVVPLGSSQVDVRRSGQDYSYSIQESRGAVAVEQPTTLHLVHQSTIPLVHHQPAIAAIPLVKTSEAHENKEKSEGPVSQPHMEMREIKGGEQLRGLSEVILPISHAQQYYVPHYYYQSYPYTLPYAVLRQY